MKKIKSKKTEVWIEIREATGYHDDYTRQFCDTKANTAKLLKFLELYDEIKPNGYKLKQLWRITTEVLTR